MIHSIAALLAPATKVVVILEVERTAARSTPDSWIRHAHDAMGKLERPPAFHRGPLTASQRSGCVSEPYNTPTPDVKLTAKEVRREDSPAREDQPRRTGELATESLRVRSPPGTGDGIHRERTVRGFP